MSDITLTRAAAPAPRSTSRPPVQKRHLFVCGVGRSGTTALCQALNLHDEIVLGVERYKYRMIGSGFPENPASLFEKQRFFRYDPQDSNVPVETGQYAGVYADARAKFDTARLVGDKIPGLYKKLPALRSGFAGCKVVFILRHPLGVAASWQNRAAKQRDNWPAKNGYEAAVTEWNRSLRLLERFWPEWGDDLVVVAYETVFGPQAHAKFADLFGPLEVSDKLTPQLDGYLNTSITAANRLRNIPDQIVQHVEQTADMDRFSQITAKLR